MGILNPKETVLDTILTTEGRKQIAESSLRATYYSFTDMGAIYEMDTIVSGSLSAGGLPFNETYRLCFEASNLPQDTIVYETDDSGKLNATPPELLNGQVINVRAGKLFEITGSTSANEIVDYTTFASLAKGVVSSSLNAFRNQMILSSPDPVDDTERRFVINPERVNWQITADRPITETQMRECSIDNVESLFFDKRLSNAPNFKYLPPINKKTSDQDTPVLIGNYQNIGQKDLLNYNPDVSAELIATNAIGYGKVVQFSETSRENNLVMQMFEVKDTDIGKLDVIDFGAFEDMDELGNTVTKHVFFCGKVFIDNNQTPTYVNMFTIVFDSDLSTIATNGISQ